MNSKQLHHNYLLRVVILMLAALSMIAQPGFADADEKQKTANSADDDSKDDDSNDGNQPPQAGDLVNYIAIHDRNSLQYNDNCNSCHAEIHTRQTLNPSIPDAHIAMLPAAPGKSDTDNNKCKWCHRSVDLVQAAGSPQEHITSIRKHIDARLCTLCHGPGGTGEQFYQVGISALNLNGTEMYGLICSGCHGKLTGSEVRGESASEITDAIYEDEGGMSPLQVLSPEQIRRIAAALN